MIAAIRVRGKPDMRPRIRAALKILNLNKVNKCCFLRENEAVKGNLRKLSNFVTWGKIDEGTFEELKKEKGKEDAELPVSFNLSPPRGGWKDKKESYKKGGSLGYRGKEIKELIKRMT